MEPSEDRRIACIALSNPAEDHEVARKDQLVSACDCELDDELRRQVEGRIRPMALAYPVARAYLGTTHIDRPSDREDLLLCHSCAESCGNCRSVVCAALRETSSRIGLVE